MNAVEISLRYRQMAPLHVHTEDEELSVLEGRLTVYASGNRVELGPGEAWVAPAGVPHTYFEAAGPTRYLIILTPRLRQLIAELQAAPYAQHAAILRQYESALLE